MSDDRHLFGEKNNADRRTRIKICGITNPIDALAAVDAGADAVGFNFFLGSPRYIDMSMAKGWLAQLPATICKIGVLVNPTLEEAINISRLDFIDALQLHGDEPPAFCRILAKRGIAFTKAIAVRNEASLRDPSSFFTAAILLDSHSENFGGSGKTFPWKLAADFVKANVDLTVILAGGLTPDNVADAICQVRPFAVDVTSGVETRPGLKDPARIRAFVAAVRG